ncbi:MAG: hypothetical protein ACRDQ2_01940 [Gaiellales bacterium]
MKITVEGTTYESPYLVVPEDTGSAKVVLVGHGEDRSTPPWPPTPEVRPE